VLDFTFVHADFLDFIDEMEDLLFADFLTGGHGGGHEGLVDDAFDLADLAFFLQVDDGDGDACFAGTTGTTTAVGVAFGIIGQAVIDDVSQVRDIQATGSYVGSYKELDVADTKLVHHVIALLLREVAVKGIGAVTVFDEFVGDFLGFYFGTAKNDAVNAGVIVGNTLEGQVFVLGVDHVVDVLHIGRAFVFVANDDFFGVAHVFAGDAGDFGWHGGREQEHVAGFGHFGQDGVDAFGESHVEHFVGFIEYDVDHA